MTRHAAVALSLLSIPSIVAAQDSCAGMSCACMNMSATPSGFDFSSAGLSGGGSNGPGGGSFSGFGVNMLSRVALADMGGAGAIGAGIWGWTDRTAPGGPREYALFGLSNGTSIVDVTNPLAPVYVGRLPTATGNSQWRELQTRGNYAFIVSDGNGNHGMQVMDLRAVRNFTGTPITFTADARYFQGNQAGAFSNAHTININEATPYAYVFGTSTHSGGAHVVDISNPLAPTFVSGYSPSGYIHDGQTVIYHGPDAAYQGREIMFAANARGSGNSNDDTVRILDVTNKASISLLGAQTHANARYIHQGRLTEDHRYFLVNDELDEWYSQSLTKTHVYDVSDLNNPVYKGGWLHPNETFAIDHNLFIKGNLVFSSEYTRGLRVYNLDDLGAASGPQMREVGWFDTYPTDDAERSFNGQWGNYPYFDSGIVIAGDRQNGLFILQIALVPEPSVYFAMMLAAAVGTAGFIYHRKRGRRTRTAS